MEWFTEGDDNAEGIGDVDLFGKLGGNVEFVFGGGSDAELFGGGLGGSVENVFGGNVDGSVEWML
jgi:hypothetical protein